MSPGDASFAPGGSASRTGWILCMGSHALTPGKQFVEATLRCDNAAAIAIVKKEEVSLRNRHLSIRTAYLRSLPENIKIPYTSTGEQKADILTKGLAKGLRQKAIRDIGMMDSSVAVAAGVMTQMTSQELFGEDGSFRDCANLALDQDIGQLERMQQSCQINCHSRHHTQISESASVPSVVRNPYRDDSQISGETVLSHKLSGSAEVSCRSSEDFPHELFVEKVLLLECRLVWEIPMIFRH